MQKVYVTVLLWLGLCLSGAQARIVTAEMELEMSVAIRNLVETTRDENDFKILVPGTVRLGFHDCVHICDGCIDTRRKVQGGNNGLEATWKPIKSLWSRNFFKYCSRADFIALANKVVSDYAAERGEQVGLCSRNLALPVNDCWPNIQVLWGRRTCEAAQLVEPIRDLPDGNQDPYEWFDEHMKFTPREAVCIMGSHTLGKLRANETGFVGDYTSQMDVLSNEFFKMMLDGSTWKQEKRFTNIDGFPQTRHQWELEDKNFTRINADMLLMYKLGDLGVHGRSKCVVPPKRPNRFNPTCKKQEHYAIVEDMARDNKVFLKCFGEAMSKMLHNGYGLGELVPTGVVIPPPPKSTRPPPTTPGSAVTTSSTSNSTKSPQRRLKGGRRKGRRGGRKRLRGGRRPVSGQQTNTNEGGQQPREGTINQLTQQLLG